MLNEIILDARELEAPEPLASALRLAKSLDDVSYIKMIHRMRPCHLFDMLTKLGVWSYDFATYDSHIIFMAKSAYAIEEAKKAIQNEYNRTIT